MLNTNLLFYLISIFLVINVSMVIFSKHPVFSLLFLVLSFLSSSFLLFLLECEVLAFLFITIYVGAIAILFLFSIMMLESKLENLSKSAIKYFPVGLIFIFIFLYPLLNQVLMHFYYINNTFINQYQNWYDLLDSINDIEIYGQVLYSNFVLQFLIAGLILLLILIGVVYLTNNFNTQQTNDQSVFKQLSRNSKLFFFTK